MRPRTNSKQGSIQIELGLGLLIALFAAGAWGAYGHGLSTTIGSRSQTQSQQSSVGSSIQAGAVFISAKIAEEAMDLAADMVGKTSPFPLRSATQLEGAVAETAVGVKTARFVLIDYDLLRKDFHTLRGRSDGEVRQWLQEQVAYISEPQTRSAVNPSIETDGRTREALRPPHYGRALVFEVDGGLIEGKGFGATDPKPHRSRNSGHSNGIASLAEALREWQFSQVLDSVSRHSQGEIDLIRPYAVIDWGFSTSDTNTRAGALLRQAHNRYPAKYEDFAFHNVSNARAIEIERVLRRYGITSTGAHRGKRILTDENLEWMNIQADFDQRRLVDFASWRVLDDSFDNRGIANIHFREPLAHGSDLPIDEALRVPVGEFYGGGADGGFDRSWRDAYRLSELIEKGKVSMDEVGAFMDERIAVVEKNLFGN